MIETQATIEDQTKTPRYELMINDWVANEPSEQTAATVAYIILGDG